MTPRFTVSHFEFFVRTTRTRFPFRYGIASMTEVPHLFVQARVVENGVEHMGVASEGLPPKWFTKNPATSFEQDLPEMLLVIGHAAQLARDSAAGPATFFDFWRDLYYAQQEWATAHDIAPLLANLGVSLVERAVLDALCRGWGYSVHYVVRENLLGIEPGQIYPELGTATARDLLPSRPSAQVVVRHTVGLGDPLIPSDIADAERVDDGLPQDLQSCIRACGLRAFKVKLSGNTAHDLARLRALNQLLRTETSGQYLCTLDGNENFKTFAAFRDFWMELTSDPLVSELVKNVVVVEQPVHRAFALADEAGTVLETWHAHPPLIIDESEGRVGDLPRALALGYAGSSHKNCKGIVKGIANACLLAHRRAAGRAGVLTGEDLCNLGPVALLQDLAMMALLGLEHVERNGHHYFRGLSPWPEAWQQTALEAHSDLYESAGAGPVRLRVRDGKLALGSVNEAPFGVAPRFDPALAGFERITLPE